MTKLQTPLDAFLHWELQTPNKIFFKQHIEGDVLNYTFKEVGTEARKIATYLKSLNLPRRSHIALLSKNCGHWIMADLAIMMADHVSIPIYPTLNAEGINQVLVHSESKAIIIGKLDNFEPQKRGIPDIPKIGLGLFGIQEGEQWEDIVKNGKALQDIPNPDLDDLHTIIYTSGTTGIPKGVMHSIGNFAESVKIFSKELKLDNHPRLFSYLPLAHVAERMGIGTFGIYKGAEFTFAESLETFATNLGECQPHLFFAVPRIWTKFQEKILEKLPQRKLNILLKIPIINSIIKKKLKEKLGLGSAEYCISGAAPLAASLIEWYKTIGITVLEVYGMTEDCVLSHKNLPADNKTGTVGKPWSGVQIKLSNDGEICIKNKCMFKGYFKNPEVTAEVFDEDGYFKTGDCGEYDQEGFLTIIGRVKDQFKTDKGKYISPSPIELEFSKNTDIEQICIVGTGLPMPIALITRSELGLSKSKDELSTSLAITLKEVCPMFEKHEKLEKVIVMQSDWNVENGLTTPTMKVKRNSIEKIHRDSYLTWYGQKESIIFE